MQNVFQRFSAFHLHETHDFHATHAFLLFILSWLAEQSFGQRFVDKKTDILS